MFRSRIKWIENDEKPKKFHLEKRNYDEKIITQLKTTEGEIIPDMTKINKEFYGIMVTKKWSVSKS